MVRSFLPKFSSKSERRLLALCKNNPKDDLDTKKWNKSAVQYIVKKFKKNLDIIDELERAISQECSNTKCVPIPKTVDNRLLVSHRRGLPQVIYCRMWRWPDLQSHHQIQAIPSCESSVGIISGVEQPLRLCTVCVNPYHYERKKPQSLDPVLVPSVSRIPPDLSTSFEDSDPTGGTKAIPNRFGPPITPAGATVRSLLSPNSSGILPSSREPRSILRESTSTGVASNTTDNSLPPPLPPPPLPPPPQLTKSGSTTKTVAFNITPTANTSPTRSTRQSPTQVEVESDTMGDQEQQQQTPQPPTMGQLHQQQQPQQQQQLQQQHQQYQQVHPQHVQQMPDQQLQQQYGGQPQMPVQQQYQQNPVDQFNEYSAPQLSHPSRQPQQRLFDQPQYTVAMVNDPNIRQAIVDAPTEIARPFQFKQHKFSHLARTMHDHDNFGPNAGYDPHGYISQPYTYTQQQPAGVQYQQTYYPHQQQAQQQGGVQYQQQGYYAQQQQQHHPQQHQQPQAGPSYSQQSQQMYQTQPTYSSSPYPQQVPGPQYQQQEQHEIQMDYTPQVSFAPSQQNVFYQYQAAGPSSMQQAGVQDNLIQIDVTEVPYVEGARWCSISYHEYDQRVGDKYQPESYTVTVDGYTHPMCNDRFCVGGLSNVNRNQFTEWVRRRINRGVKFTYVDGDVYVECISDSSIFVSTPMLGIEEGKDSPDKVTKVPAGGTVKVFNTTQFSKLLASAVPKGFEAVYKLTNYCSYRVSFVKGWGRNYKRHTILDVPCWIEVQLNGPLQWIDKVLRQMRPPSQGCGSTS